MRREEKLRELRRRVLRWYRRSGRSLPWRTTRDPYRIWVSEVMLQQTQVDRVREYYRAFLSRFPTLGSLAAARWSEVLPRWRGLGYYQRGRNLLSAAKAIEKDHAGEFPRTAIELRALPGIGPYTANALLSFAFGKAAPAFDTNMRRVVTRIFWGAKVPPEKLADELFALSAADGAALNHALMDVGALYCSSRKPRCGECPAREVCSYFRKGRRQAPTHSRPQRKKAVDVAAACIRQNGQYLVAKRPKRKGGEWEFPGGKRLAGEDIRHCLKREIAEELGIEVAVRPAFHVKEFSKNGVLHRLHFCRCQILRGKPRPREHQAIRWLPAAELSAASLAPTNRVAARKLSD